MKVDIAVFNRAGMFQHNAVGLVERKAEDEDIMVLNIDHGRREFVRLCPGYGFWIPLADAVAAVDPMSAGLAQSDTVITVKERI